MNSKENQLILSAIEEEIKPNTFLAVDRVGDKMKGFYFHIGKIKINIIGNYEDTIIHFSHSEFREEEIFLTIAIPFEQSKEFLNNINKRLIKQDYCNYKEQDAGKFLTKEVEVIKKFLREYKDIRPENMNSDINILSENEYGKFNHKITPGRITYTHSIHEDFKYFVCNNVGQLSLNTTIEYPQGSIQFGLVIPCWEIDEYPLIMQYIKKQSKNETVTNTCNHDIKEVISQLNLYCPQLASNIMYEQLENKVEQQLKNKEINIIKKKKL